jgi:capsule polysaccharide export protein KpsE/RkpR
MNLPHPKPEVLAPVVNSQGRELNLYDLELSQQQIAQRLTDHKNLHLKNERDLHARIDAMAAVREEMAATRDAVVKAHAELVEARTRIEVLESRWYEKLAKWIGRTF